MLLRIHSFFIALTLLMITSSAYAVKLPIHQKISQQDLQAFLLQPQEGYNFEGIVKLNNCSGALVRFENSRDTDPGMVMTNGHCVPVGVFGGFIKPNEFIANKKVRRQFQLLNSDGSMASGAYLYSTKIAYATMTGTDVGIYELEKTFAEIKAEFKVDALMMDSHRPSNKDAIQILSGYWQRGYACRIDGFIHQIKEADYIWDDSLRYERKGCNTIHGTSGSPILSANTNKVIGINNTGNDDGKRCTMNNPCEVSTDGTIRVEKDRSYGQQTHQIYSCLNMKREIDVTVSGCKLFHGAM